MQRKTLRIIISGLFRILSRVEYCGTENLPPEGGLIVATNHMSRVDTLLLFLNPARTDITALVADKYKKYPVFNKVLDWGGVIWLDRDKADFGALRVAVEWIKKGVCMGIAPEGTRSTTGELQEGKPGVVLLAQKSGAPIVPVGIAGTERFFHELVRLRRPKGPPDLWPGIHPAAP